MARKDVVFVNEEEVEVNKHQLASHSDYFERFFFGGEYKKNTKIEVEPPATVEDFKRMMDAMEPDNRLLDDDCIEGVCHLADRFLLRDVQLKCRNFLFRDSKHSAIFKYRLADKYGFAMLKNLILGLPKEEFLKEADFRENLNEFAKLNEKAREELDARIGQLFENVAQ